jgi:hypothetical protein
MIIAGGGRWGLLVRNPAELKTEAFAKHPNKTPAQDKLQVIDYIIYTLENRGAIPQHVY